MRNSRLVPRLGGHWKPNLFMSVSHPFCAAKQRDLEKKVKANIIHGSNYCRYPNASFNFS